MNGVDDTSILDKDLDGDDNVDGSLRLLSDNESADENEE